MAHQFKIAALDDHYFDGAFKIRWDFSSLLPQNMFTIKSGESAAFFYFSFHTAYVCLFAENLETTEQYKESEKCPGWCGSVD